jgi:hypothetical protein
MKEQTGPRVASLPILIPCFKKGEEEGEALIWNPPSYDAVLLRNQMALPVRRFKDADFTNAVKLMGDGGTKRFIALRLLLTAITNKQREDIQKARDMLCAALAFHCREIERYEHSVPRSKKE